MRIAIPTSDGKLDAHFGHCAQMALIDVDPQTKAILSQEIVETPEHAPGLFPRWVRQHGATVVIAGRMGARAQKLFSRHGIEVIVGVTEEDLETLVAQYLGGTLVSGVSLCDH